MLLATGGNILARFLYTVFFYLLLPVIVLRLLLRSLKAPDYRRRWGERFGFIRSLQAEGPVIWVHSVSVGETLAAVPMIRALQAQNPGARLVVTTMTPTGSARVKASFGDSVYHVYVPYDIPGALNRFLSRVKPDVLVIMETELWPNLIHCCARKGVPMVVANARLSEKSAAGYGKLRSLTAEMLRKVTAIAAQHEDDGRRFVDLGLAPEKLSITGNIKFDLTIDDTLRAGATDLKQQWRGSCERPILLVASTHRGEDEIVLDAFAQILADFPSLLLVLVPRHPERFGEVAELCQQRGFSVVKRSHNRVPAEADQVLLGDTMGELLLFFGACDIAFVAGSLVPVGGHNMIEPAAWGVPVLTGPHLFNFSEASRLMLEADGMAICNSASELAAAVIKLLSEPGQAEAMGASANRVAEQNRGALDKLLALIARQL